ncbi:MAG: helix-turn-helix transcriptional regulator [Clostridia bacterium]|nr:helix-turn-helix transcriptional regulator [Clostridia bacterium]
MALGERLTHFRIQSGMTQKRFAEMIGISPTRLNYYEKNKRQPDIDMIRKLSDGLGITVNDLLDPNATTPPVPEETEVCEQSTYALETELRALLIRLNLIAPGEELTADQSDFLLHLAALIKIYFKK